jgi:hypothetical protein
MDSASLRHKLYDYIRIADTKKLHAIFNLLENEIEESIEWWKNKEFTDELDNRYEALEDSSDKGFTLAEMETSIEKLRVKKYGK